MSAGELPAEFALIARHFAPLAGPGTDNLKDDVALLTPPQGRVSISLRRATWSSAFNGPITLASSDTSLPSVSPKPPGSRKSRCMSMITSAQVCGSNL